MIGWLKQRMMVWAVSQIKESLAYRVIYEGLPHANGVSSKRNYESFAREGYASNPTVNACVNEIATAAARVPLVLYTRKRNGDLDEITDHPALKLLERPNPLQGGPQFMQAVVAYLMISGNTYIEGAGPGERRPPRELYTLRPDRMTVIPHRFNLVGGYKYTVKQGSVTYTPDEVLHTKLFHPFDDFYGLSPMEAAALAVDRSNQADKWNAAIFNNMGVPSGLLTSKQPMTDEQYRRTVEQVEELFGVQKARKPIVGDTDMEWKELGQSAVDLDFVNGKKMTALEIAQTYNMPPELIGLMPATYQNRKEARKALYTEVVLPVLDILLGNFNNWLLPRYAEGLYLDVNTDAIEALSEDKDSLFKRANESKFLTVNEQREMVGYETVPDGDVVLVPLNVIPLADASLGVPQEGGEDDLGGDDEERGCPLHDHETKDARPIEGKAFTPSERKRYRREFREVARLRERFQRKLLGRVRTAFDGDAAALATAFESGGLEGALTELARREKTAWRPMIERHAQDVLRAFGRRALDQAKSAAPEIETKQDEAEDLFASIVNDYARRHAAEAVTKISETTAEALRAAVTEGLAEGLPTEEIAGRIAQAIGDEKGRRSMTIARTETHAAQNTGQVEQIRALGRDDMLKGWLWSGVSRSEHAAIDGTWVGLEDKFSVGGTMMDRPGDPAGGAENVINCSCTLVFKRE